MTSVVRVLVLDVAMGYLVSGLSFSVVVLVGVWALGWGFGIFPVVGVG